jgi:hypothetical protein
MVFLMARAKNRSFQHWFFLSLILSPIICFIILIFLRKLPESFSFNGEKKLSNDAYLIYLTKQYKIEFNTVLNKFTCDDKLFTTSDAAVAFAHAAEIESETVEISRRI